MASGDNECSECGQDFKTERRLERHMKKAHDKTYTPKKRKLAYAGVGVLALVLVAGLLLAGGGGAETQAQALEDLGATDDPALGDRSAPVAVVAFETPRCPSCRAFHERIQPDIKRNYIDPGQVVLYYQQFTIGYRYDEPGGIAQECVYKHQGDGAFWTLTDTLYAEQGQWTAENTGSRLSSLGDRAGWDRDAVVSCYQNRETQSAYQADVDVGRRKGVSGTPFFFVVGPDGSTTTTGAGDLEATIQDALEKAGEA